jgi:hypothetical protein
MYLWWRKGFWEVLLTIHGQYHENSASGFLSIKSQIKYSSSVGQIQMLGNDINLATFYSKSLALMLQYCMLPVIFHVIVTVVWNKIQKKMEVGEKILPKILIILSIYVSKHYFVQVSRELSNLSKIQNI